MVTDESNEDSSDPIVSVPLDGTNPSIATVQLGCEMTFIEEKRVEG